MAWIIQLFWPPVLFACTTSCATNLLARCLPSVIPLSFILLPCSTLAVGCRCVAPSSVGSLRQPLSRLSRLVPQRRGIVLCSSHAVAVVSKRMFVTTITAHVRDVVVHYLCGMCRCCRSHSAASDQLSCSSPVPPSFVHPTAMPSLSHVFVTRCIILATLLYTQPHTNVVVKLPFAVWRSRS